MLIPACIPTFEEGKGGRAKEIRKRAYLNVKPSRHLIDEIEDVVGWVSYMIGKFRRVSHLKGSNSGDILHKMKVLWVSCDV
jgi:hypothetical protein